MHDQLQPWWSLERAPYDRAAADARVALGAEAYAAEFAAGQALSPEAAVKYAVAGLESD